MSTDITEEKSGKRGISRRDLIKKGAVAGAIVWTVPFIESVPAYATTGSVQFIGASYVYVVYIDDSNNMYVASYGNSGGPCTQGTNNCPLVATVELHGTTATGALDIYTWNGGSVNVTLTTTSGTQTVTSLNCTNLTQTGNTITALAGYTIIAVVAFGGNVGNTHCHDAYITTGGAIVPDPTGNLLITGTGDGNSTTINGL